MSVRRSRLSRSEKEVFLFLLFVLSAFVGLRAVLGESTTSTTTSTSSSGETVSSTSTSTATSTSTSSGGTATTTTSSTTSSVSGTNITVPLSTSLSSPTLSIPTVTSETLLKQLEESGLSGTDSSLSSTPTPSASTPTISPTTTTSPTYQPTTVTSPTYQQTQTLPTYPTNTVSGQYMLTQPVVGTEPLPRRQEWEGSPLSEIEKIRNAKEAEQISKPLSIIDRARFENSEEDTDHDAIPDVEEMRLGTDPRSADTDRDGYVDGAEVFGGYDPKVFSPGDGRDKVVFESVKEKKDAAPRTDRQYTVQAVEHAVSTTDPTKSVIRLSGKGAPNRLITLYIYSDPIIVTVKTDAEGNWVYDLDKELPDGDHEVYVAVTDNVGKVAAVSEPLPFVKTAQAVTVKPTSAMQAKQNVSPLERSRARFILVGVVVTLTFLGLAIVFIGRRSSLFTR